MPRKSQASSYKNLRSAIKIDKVSGRLGIPGPQSDILALQRGETMSSQALSSYVSISDFVAELRKFQQSAFDRTDQIINFMEAMPVAPDTLQPYLSWDRQHYTRNLIDKTPFYELIAICWEVGQVSSVHNHRDQNCWMAVPIGRLLVENYRVVYQNIDQGKCQLEAAETVEMNPRRPCAVDPLEPVHRVYNPREFNQRAVSLHVYSRPFDSCVVYSPEQGTCGEIKLHYTTEYGERVKS
jgi:cysteine dioxygenase